MNRSRRQIHGRSSSAPPCTSSLLWEQGNVQHHTCQHATLPLKYHYHPHLHSLLLGRAEEQPTKQCWCIAVPTKQIYHNGTKNDALALFAPYTSYVGQQIAVGQVLMLFVVSLVVTLIFCSLTPPILPDPKPRPSLSGFMYISGPVALTYLFSIPTVKPYLWKKKTTVNRILQHINPDLFHTLTAFHTSSLPRPLVDSNLGRTS